jgi:hypothetical protein
VSTVMNLRVSEKAWNFLTGERRLLQLLKEEKTVLPGVS